MDAARGQPMPPTAPVLWFQSRVENPCTEMQRTPQGPMPRHPLPPHGDVERGTPRPQRYRNEHGLSPGPVQGFSATLGPVEGADSRPQREKRPHPRPRQSSGPFPRNNGHSARTTKHHDETAQEQPPPRASPREQRHQRRTARKAVPTFLSGTQFNQTQPVDALDPYRQQLNEKEKAGRAQEGRMCVAGIRSKIRHEPFLHTPSLRHGL